MNPAFDQVLPSPGLERGPRLDQPAAVTPATSSQARPPVAVTLPSEIDITNASQVHDALTQALESGTAVVIADATETIFCDCAGVRALIQAGRQAAAAGTDLRVGAVTSPTVRRIFDLTGADQVLDIHPTLAAAQYGRAGFP